MSKLGHVGKCCIYKVYITYTCNYVFLQMRTIHTRSDIQYKNKSDPVSNSVIQKLE